MGWFTKGDGTSPTPEQVRNKEVIKGLKVGDSVTFVIPKVRMEELVESTGDLGLQERLDGDPGASEFTLTGEVDSRDKSGEWVNIHIYLCDVGAQRFTWRELNRIIKGGEEPDFLD